MSAPAAVDEWCERVFSVTSALYSYMDAHPHSTKGAARRHLRNPFSDMRRAERSYERMRDHYGYDDYLKEQIDLCFSHMMEAKKEFQTYMREQPKSQAGGTRRRRVKRNQTRRQHRL